MLPPLGGSAGPLTAMALLAPVAPPAAVAVRVTPPAAKGTATSPAHTPLANAPETGGRIGTGVESTSHCTFGTNELRVRAAPVVPDQVSGSPKRLFEMPDTVRDVRLV